MIDLLPIELYTPIYYYVTLLVVSLTFIHTQFKSIDDVDNVLYLKRTGALFFIFTILYMGLRPIDIAFIDMPGYNRLFEYYAYGGEIKSVKDPLFHIFTKFSSKIMSAQVYFFICALFYLLPLYIVCKKWFNNYWFFGFLFLAASFSFWSYGTNGIRNGMAGSFFLLGISRDKRLWQIVLITMAVSIHKTMLLPSAAFVFVNLYNKPKFVLIIWLLTIPISLFNGEFFEEIFSYIGFGEDNRLESYLMTEASQDRFNEVGFRWDFLLYSSIAVIAGWYFIFKRKFNDKVYSWLFTIYVLANAFWILVIRANYSNRFAYLSWFIIALLVIYPLLKQKFFVSQNSVIGVILVLYFSFTFIMNVVLA